MMRFLISLSLRLFLTLFVSSSLSHLVCLFNFSFASLPSRLVTLNRKLETSKIRNRSSVVLDGLSIFFVHIKLTLLSRRYSYSSSPLFAHFSVSSIFVPGCFFLSVPCLFCLFCFVSSNHAFFCLSVETRAATKGGCRMGQGQGQRCRGGARSDPVHQSHPHAKEGASRSVQ